jgi:hypothetical protein
MESIVLKGMAVKDSQLSAPLEHGTEQLDIFESV